MRLRTGALSLAWALALAAPARADGVRYDACDPAGSSCHNAIAGHLADDPAGASDPAQAVAKGTCENATCERGGPDGGVVFDCLRCIADGNDKGGCSCRAAGAPRRGALALVMGFVGVLALAWSRRARS